MMLRFNDDDDDICLCYLPGWDAVVGGHVRLAEGVLHTGGGLHPDQGGAHAGLIYCKIKRGSLWIKSFHDQNLNKQIR